MRLWISIFLTMIAAASCSLDEVRETMSGNYPIIAEVGEAKTRVSINGDNHPYWDKGDRLSFCAVSAGGTTGEAVLTVNLADAGQETARFKGDVYMDSEPVDCHFAYPGDSRWMQGGNVLYTCGGDASERFSFMYGSAAYNAESMDCRLSHVGGVLHLHLADNVSSVTVKGNNFEKISSFVYAPADGSISIPDDAEETFTVHVNGPEAYIAMPPVNFSRGFAIISITQDGKKMYKSFSTDGGIESGYDFSTNAGVLLDIDMSSFTETGLTADVSYEHIYQEGVLVGTNVSLGNVLISGCPEKLYSGFSSVTAELAKDDGTVVRNFRYDGKPTEIVGNELMAEDNGWIFLPAGDYRLSLSTEFYGDKVISEKILTVGVPEINVAVSAYTNYDTYLSGNVSAANAQDGSTVFDISSVFGISSEILNNANYAKPSVKYNIGGSQSDSYEYSESLTHSYGDVSSLAFAAYEVKAVVDFCGVEYIGSKVCNVTGLPFLPRVPTQADWTRESGTAVEWNSEYVKLETASGGSEIKMSNEFFVPENINVSALVTYVLYDYIFSTKANFQLSVGGSTIIDKSNSSANRNGTWYTDQTADGTLTTSNKSVVMKNTYPAIGPHVDVYKFGLYYR